MCIVCNTVNLVENSSSQLFCSMTEKYSIYLKCITTRAKVLLILIIHISDIVAIPKNLKQVQDSVLVEDTFTHNETVLSDGKEKLLKVR